MDAMVNETNGTRPKTTKAPVVSPTRQQTTTKAEEAIRLLIETLGEDPDREGLRDTPKRVVAALLELTAGYEERPTQVLGRIFHEEHEGLVIVKDIPFASLCEHHLLPVEGTANIAYLPDGRILGLSKLSRIVQTFARRLQLQERMTDQIAHAIDTRVSPRGVAVMISARHACMALRGVRTSAPMITTCNLGEMQTPENKTEFLQLVRGCRDQ